MKLRSLVITAGAWTVLLASPIMGASLILGRPDVLRGLLLGVVVGVLNSMLLARKLDRVCDGIEPWQTLTATMPRNMIMRFALIFAIGAAASQVHTINIPAMAGGLGLCLVVGIVYSSATVASRWRKEDGTPVYG